MEAIYIPEHSVVKLPDGRVGRLTNTKKRGKRLVILPGREILEIKTSTDLEVFVYPYDVVDQYVAINHPGPDRFIQHLRVQIGASHANPD